MTAETLEGHATRGRFGDLAQTEVTGSMEGSVRDDETALSPTASVILMVAITVGLAILLYFMVTWGGPNH